MARSSINPVPGPVRTCVGCRERVTASELLRVTAGSDGEGHLVLTPDPGRTAPGRGAHVHPTSECFDLAVRRRAFPRALRVEGALSSTRVSDYLASLDT
ncbi:YlxR family protein [Nocardioides seonyuensis]|uniref:YlxR family protein n=1 Tax=Nocardioides seonyuensis TaxID=2518371 RepID=UPI0031342711